ncbi:UPAR/Ly6 domain-containing protein crok [Anoplolepis gracilipes]|uniref:UPAR/Ly6 domain-containing protein crok n=1 Tax=Anoplolepis gracilipes TaxID=354296 RepID=UPI003BA26DAC
MKRVLRARSIVITLCSILLFFCYSGVEAIQCYQCNSRNNSQCADLVPPDSMKMDCSDLRDGAKYTMCRKITQVIEFSVNGLPPDTRVIRGCGWDESNYKGKCYQRSGFGGRQEVCSCLNDYCNTATPGFLPPQGLILSCALISMLLAFLRN